MATTEPVVGSSIDNPFAIHDSDHKRVYSWRRGSCRAANVTICRSLPFTYLSMFSDNHDIFELIYSASASCFVLDRGRRNDQPARVYTASELHTVSVHRLHSPSSTSPFLFSGSLSSTLPMYTCSESPLVESPYTRLGWCIRKDTRAHLQTGVSCMKHVTKCIFTRIDHDAAFSFRPYVFPGRQTPYHSHKRNKTAEFVFCCVFVYVEDDGAPSSRLRQKSESLAPRADVGNESISVMRRRMLPVTILVTFTGSSFRIESRHQVMEKLQSHVSWEYKSVRGVCRASAQDPEV